MSVYSFSMVEITRYQWEIPTPVAYGELLQAVDAARARFAEVFGGYPTADDAIRLEIGDEAVVLFFEHGRF